jgi:hypothetical protein
LNPRPPEPQSGALPTELHSPLILSSLRLSSSSRAIYSRSLGQSRSFHGAPEGTRTPDPRLRRPLLCPPELLARFKSGRADLNGRPPAPKAGALPGCATPRALKRYHTENHLSRNHFESLLSSACSSGLDRPHLSDGCRLRLRIRYHAPAIFLRISAIALRIVQISSEPRNDLIFAVSRAIAVANREAGESRRPILLRFLAGTDIAQSSIALRLLPRDNQRLSPSKGRAIAPLAPHPRSPHGSPAVLYPVSVTKPQSSGLTMSSRPAISSLLKYALQAFAT